MRQHVSGPGGPYTVRYDTYVTFPDVPEDAWYADVVSRAAGIGYVSGYSNGNYGPDDPITRGQLAVMLWNVAGRPQPTGTPRSFPDVSADKYYYQAVRWASSVGVVSGYKSGNFGPNDRATREQLATMLANYARRISHKSVSGGYGDFSHMSDAGRVSSYARVAVGWCFRNKILSGSGSYIRPQSNTTRAETAKMVVYLHETVR